MNTTVAMAALFVHPSLSAPRRPSPSCHPSLSIIRRSQCVPVCATPLRLMITFSQVTLEAHEEKKICCFTNSRFLDAQHLELEF